MLRAGRWCRVKLHWPKAQADSSRLRAGNAALLQTWLKEVDPAVACTLHSRTAVQASLLVWLVPAFWSACVSVCMLRKNPHRASRPVRPCKLQAFQGCRVLHRCCMPGLHPPLPHSCAGVPHVLACSGVLFCVLPVPVHVLKQPFGPLAVPGQAFQAPRVPACRSWRCAWPAVADYPVPWGVRMLVP